MCLTSGRRQAVVARRQPARCWRAKQLDRCAARGDVIVVREALAIAREIVVVLNRSVSQRRWQKRAKLSSTSLSLSVQSSSQILKQSRQPWTHSVRYPFQFNQSINPSVPGVPLPLFKPASNDWNRNPIRYAPISAESAGDVLNATLTLTRQQGVSFVLSFCRFREVAS